MSPLIRGPLCLLLTLGMGARRLRPLTSCSRTPARMRISTTRMLSRLLEDVAGRAVPLLGVLRLMVLRLVVPPLMTVAIPPLPVLLMTAATLLVLAAALLVLAAAFLVLAAALLVLEAALLVLAAMLLLAVVEPPRSPTRGTPRTG